MLQLQPGMHIHLVGIGGAGLSAIARILLERGYQVSGSDMNASQNTTALAADGARISQGHQAANIRGADVVLATSAVGEDHIELQAAASLGISVCRRREFIGALLHGYDTIAVAGTHGKTTTTSMLIHILQSAEREPSYIVGGAMGNTGKNAGVGAGSVFVIEADEYDNMYHGLHPSVAVVTNVEHDHPDFFSTSADLTRSFETFVALIDTDGLLVYCADDPAAQRLAEKHLLAGGQAIGYGIGCEQAAWRATGLRFTQETTNFTLLKDRAELGPVSLGIPGTHNVLNASAALAVADARGVSFEQAAAALNTFKSPARRFEMRGVRDDVIVIDDYAHHPTEIKTSIQAARLRYPRRRVWAIWQPHTYSRVRHFWGDFIRAIAEADHVLVLPIYAAREAPIEGVSSDSLVAALNWRSTAIGAPTFADAAAILRESVDPPAIVLIFSAGDANRIADLYLSDGG